MQPATGKQAHLDPGHSVIVARYAPVAAALTTYLVLGSLLCSQTPLWIPPDEELHVAYCQHIARNKTLPRAAGSGWSEPVIMAFHPPLYYIAGSLFFGAESERVENIVRINDGPGYALLAGGAENSELATGVYRLRFFTLLCGALIIVAAYAAVCILLPQTALPATVAAFFVAANPQLLHVAAGISNEIPAAALCSIVLLMLLLYCRQRLPAATVLLMGCLLGLSLLTKTSTLFLVPLSILVIVLARRQPSIQIIRDLTLTLSSAGMICGWWYVLNWKILRSIQTSQPWFNRRTPISLDYLTDIVSTTFISFFGFFGSQQIALPWPQLVFYALIIAAGLCGFIQSSICKTHTRPFTVTAGVLLTAFAGGAAVFTLLNYTYYAPQGKYLYTVIVPIAALVGGGYLSLFSSTRKAIAAVALICLMTIFCATTLFSVFLPAVQEPRLRRIAAQPDFDCITAHISAVQPLSFSFQATDDNLCGIRVLFSKTDQTDAGALIFHLAHNNAHKGDVCRTVVPLSDIRDTHWHYFSFAPIPDSAGKNFLIHLQSRGVSPEARPALWCARQPAAKPSPDAAHGTVHGCLPCFEAYAFTGTIPKTLWEGRTTRAIRQQLYVSVREMQLFTQCAPGSPNKEKISRKWQRLEKAAINRHSGCFELPDPMR